MTVLAPAAIPVTFDCPPEEGGHDPVLALLRGARARYARGASRMTYGLSGGRACCGVGACLVEGGSAPRAGAVRKTVKRWLRHGEHLQSTTLEALRLLEAEARRRHPVRSKLPTRWTGHFERLNQCGHVAETLDVFDAVIARREALAA